MILHKESTFEIKVGSTLIQLELDHARNYVTVGRKDGEHWKFFVLDEKPIQLKELADCLRLAYDTVEANIGGKNEVDS